MPRLTLTPIGRAARLSLLTASLCAVAVAVSRTMATAQGDAVSQTPSRTVRIALVSDPHATLAQTGDEAAYKERFDRVIAEVNEARVDMVLVAGDLTQSGKPEQIAQFKAQVKNFRAPVRTVFGNHDVGAKRGITGAKPGDGVSSERVARLEAELGPSFWSDTLSGVRIVGVNASLWGSGLPAETRQWAFTERALKPARDAAAPPTLLLSHYPLYLSSPDEPGGVYWNVEPAPRARLLSLIEKSGTVRAVLCGHLHRAVAGRTAFGVFLYATPPVSFGLPKDRQPEGWTLVTLSLPGGAVQTEFRPIAHDATQTSAPQPTASSL